MEGKGAIVVITATTLLMMANIVMATTLTTNSMTSIKQSKENCFAKCIIKCLDVAIPNICLIYCIYCCTHSSCPPSYKSQRFSPLSFYCNAGCSLHNCANIKGLYLFPSDFFLFFIFNFLMYVIILKKLWVCVLTYFSTFIFWTGAKENQRCLDDCSNIYCKIWDPKLCYDIFRYQ